MSKVSVIIPCFNLGEYIYDAINSVLNQTFKDFEIIVVNDGSTDLKTNQILNNLDNPQIKVVTTDNQGLANARNNGIVQASGKYILPLDADDKIASDYLEKAVKILDQNENLGIVYCLAEFFGEENYKWDLPEYNLSRILIDNLIFCSAFFRKEDWKSVGGYKSVMIYGWEDYDFWLSIIELKREVYRIPEQLFYYRKRVDSMANVMSRENLYHSYKQLVKNHSKIYIDNIDSIFEYIYSLRDIIIEKQQKEIIKDTHIHNLNLEASNLNTQIADLDMQIANLNIRITHLNSQLSNGRVLIRLLYRHILRYFKIVK